MLMLSSAVRGRAAGCCWLSEGLLLLDVIGELAQCLVSNSVESYESVRYHGREHTVSPARRSWVDCGPCLYRSALVAIVACSSS